MDDGFLPHAKLACAIEPESKNLNIDTLIENQVFNQTGELKWLYDTVAKDVSIHNPLVFVRIQISDDNTQVLITAYCTSLKVWLSGFVLQDKYASQRTMICEDEGVIVEYNPYYPVCSTKGIILNCPQELKYDGYRIPKLSDLEKLPRDHAITRYGVFGKEFYKKLEAKMLEAANIRATE